MIFMRVDLPAPFSPMRACTVPHLSCRETSSSATTPGNRLLTFLTSSRQPSGASLARPRMACSVPAQVIRQISRRHQLERDPHEACNVLTLDELQRRVDGSSSLGGGVLKYGGPEISRFHCGEPIGRGVDPRDDRSRKQFRLLQGLNGADSHFIVIGQYRLRTHASAQPVGHEVGGLGALPVGRLFLNNPYPTALRSGNYVIDVLGALASGLVRQLADPADHLAL